MTDTPIASADPYHNKQNRKYNEGQTTFAKTTGSSFWRRLNVRVHFRDFMWILAWATITFSYRLCNATLSICVQLGMA